MEQLFNRDGTEFDGAPEHDDAGKPVRYVPIACNRCHVINGQRLWVMGTENGRPYSRTGFDCWTCGNSGVRGQRKERLYTATELVRVNKSAATREARKAEAHRIAVEQAHAARDAKAVAYRAEFADFLVKIATLCTGNGSDFWDRLAADLLVAFRAPTARQIELVEGEVAKREKNASSKFVGVIGKKIELRLTIERIITLQSEFYGTNYITIARTPEGNVVTYKGLTDLGNVGETRAVKATVKDHAVYKDTHQTVIQRPRVLP